MALSALSLECAAPPPVAAGAPSAPGVAWSYEVNAEDVSLLDVEGTFARGSGDAFYVDPPALHFVRDVRALGASDWVSVARRGRAFIVPCRDGCRVRYRMALREAAREIADTDTAIAAGDVVIAPPSTWLLHPEPQGSSQRFEFRVKTAPNERFLSGVERTAEGPPTYAANTGDLESSSFAAFGGVHTAKLDSGGATIEVGIAPHRLGLSDSEVLAWIGASVEAVAEYYRGQLPARRALVLVMKGSGSTMRGLTLGGGGPAILVRAPDGVTPSALREDWVATHELFHVNFPDLGPKNAWLSEGLATYLEPLARARVGDLDPRKVWQDLIEGLPQGLPQAGDLGLARTHTWGRTYWGGALFCLVADVAIREQTANARSLDDAILAIGKTGATADSRWNVERVLDVGDAATGTRVLHELYDKMALEPGSVDLSALFTRLGVRMERGAIAFDDSAPSAQIRRSVTARRPDRNQSAPLAY